MNELPALATYALYFALVSGVILLPGMDMAFVLASTLARGRRAGLAAVAGIVGGGVAHTAMGTLGAGLVLLSAPAVYNTMLMLGAGYMSWLGWTLWRDADGLCPAWAQGDDATPPGTARWPGPAAVVPRSLRATFGGALVTCLLNPKAYIFTLAVLPQFLRPAQGSIAAQAVVLALITAATQVGVYGAVAWAADRLRRTLQQHPAAPRRLGRGVAALLMLAALLTLWQGWKPPVPGDVAAGHTTQHAGSFW